MSSSNISSQFYSKPEEKLIRTEPLPIFAKHLSPVDLKTSDPYDVWNTTLGQNIKKVYYKNRSIFHLFNDDIFYCGVLFNKNE